MSISLRLNPQASLEHGGRLRRAAHHYGIAYSDWMDLSTGINPNGWPIPPMPNYLWNRLPEDDDGLVDIARGYYGSEHILPVAGSQAALQALPHLRDSSRVCLLHPSYAEHARAWRGAGHRVTMITDEAIADRLPECDVLVLVHPNNPTGVSYPLAQLLDWRSQLAARGGWLVVDEAFVDCTPTQSIVPHSDLPGLIVLRSLGKFFGLAGARVGFVCATPSLLNPLHAMLGPWTVNHPSRWVASCALSDFNWQQRARTKLIADSERLSNTLTRHGFAPAGGCALFQWVKTPHAQLLHDGLARQGLLTRWFDDLASLRFGLPKDEPQWQRLEHALAQLESDP